MKQTTGKPEVYDLAALEAAYPQCVTTETITRKTVNRRVLGQILKAAAVLGKEVPGVRIGEAPAEVPAEVAADPAPEGAKDDDRIANMPEFLVRGAKNMSVG